jgi:hypothetical protein
MTHHNVAVDCDIRFERRIRVHFDVEGSKFSATIWPIPGLVVTINERLSRCENISNFYLSYEAILTFDCYLDLNVFREPRHFVNMFGIQVIKNFEKAWAYFRSLGITLCGLRM